MTTTREQALAGLFLCLKGNVPDAEILRNAPLPTKVPDTGLIIVRDGDILLLPLVAIFTISQGVKISVQNGINTEFFCFILSSCL